jgi:hypothetical protein
VVFWQEDVQVTSSLDNILHEWFLLHKIWLKFENSLEAAVCHLIRTLQLAPALMSPLQKTMFLENSLYALWFIQVIMVIRGKHHGLNNFLPTNINKLTIFHMCLLAPWIYIHA